MKRNRVMPLLALSVVALLVTTFAVAPTVTATSSGVTALTIRPPDAAYSTVPFVITGKLTGGPTGVGVSDKLITVYASTNGKKWTTAGTAWTDNGGYYTVTTSQPTAGKYFYEATFAGDKIFKKVTSPTITVTVGALIAPTAAFSSDVQTGPWPLIVQFTSTSTGAGPLTYAWDFGDGATITAQNPSHTYATVGTYTVKLTVTGPGGTNSVVKTDYITVTKVQPVLTLTLSSASAHGVTSTATFGPTISGATVDLWTDTYNGAPYTHNLGPMIESPPGTYTFTGYWGGSPGDVETLHAQFEGNDLYLPATSNEVTLTGA